MSRAADDQSDAVEATLRFAILPEWVLFALISPAAKILFAILQRHDGPNGVFPTRARLARLMSCSVDTIDRYLQELIRIGAVDVQRRFRLPDDRSAIVAASEVPSGARAVPTSNLYVLHMAGPFGVIDGSRTDAATRQGRGEGGRTDAARVAARMRHDPDPHEREPFERLERESEAEEGDITDAERKVVEYLRAQALTFGPTKSLGEHFGIDVVRRGATVADVDLAVSRTRGRGYTDPRRALPFMVAVVNGEVDDRQSRGMALERARLEKEDVNL